MYKLFRYCTIIVYNITYCLIFVACQIDSKTLTTLELDNEDVITIPVDNLSAPLKLLSQYFIDKIENEFLIHINTYPTDPNYIFFDNLRSSNESFKLSFPIEGPNGVGTMTDFYFHNFDSIFIVNRYAYTLSLVDSSGTLLNTFKLKKSTGNKPDENSVLPLVSSKSRMLLRENKLYIPGIPDVNPYKSGYKKKQLLIEVDLISGKLDYHLGYPSKYKTGGYWGGPDHIQPSIAATKNPSKILVSYPISDSVYIYDLEKKMLKSVFMAKSQLIGEIFPGNYQENSREQKLKYQLGTDYYFSLIYDPYEEVYYRFTYKSYSDESIEKMLKREKGDPNEKSILLFDANFNNLKEFILPKEGNIPYEFYPTKAGPYILLNIDNEDERKFVKINFN